MRKFNLSIHAVSDSSQFEEVLKSKRIYHTITVRQAVKGFSNATKILLQKHGSKLRFFKYFNADVPSVKKLFECTPLLETLELQDVISTPTNKDESLPISLPKLKHLKYFSLEPSKNFLALIVGMKALKSFNVNVVRAEDRDMVIKFLMKHPGLETLTIGNRMDNNFFTENDVSDFKFKLRKLDIEACLTKPTVTQESFSGFMQLHESTLTNLTITGEISTDFYEIVFKQFSNLTDLELNVTSLPNEKSFYFCCISPLTSVKRLKLQGRFKKHETANWFFSLFPAVKELDVKELRTVKWFPSFLKKIAKYQQNLEHLAIRNFYEGTPKDQQFKVLKSIDVDRISTNLHWKKFVSGHRDTLESLTVDDYMQGKLSPNDIEDILSPKLRHIRFNSRSKSTKEIFNVVRKDYKKLKIAEFGQTNEKPVDTRSIEIYFPSDKREWHPEQYDHFFN